MRLGFGLLTLQLNPAHPRSATDRYAQSIELAVEAERLGLDSIWTSEHHFVDDAYLPSQLPVLAAIAARTSRIRLGTGVQLAPMFDPLHIAEDAAVVDLLSKGRLILGLGLGWRVEEFEAFGVPFRQRAGRTEAIIQILRDAWSDGLAQGDDRYFHFKPVNVTPKPERAGGVPIWIGAGAEPAVRRVARMADGYYASGASVRAMAERVGWIQDEAERVGRDPATIDLAVQRLTFAWRDGDAWTRIRDYVRYIDWKYSDMGPARASRSPRPAPPMTGEEEEALKRRVTFGTPEQVAEQILEYRESIGPDGLFAARSYFPGLDPQIQMETLRILGEEVQPLIA